MLTLITGLPGNGKTLYALAYVKAWAERETRTVWYHGIADLTLPWHKIATTREKVNGRDEDVPRWWDCPARSIIVIDEAQKAGFGVRPRGVTPEWAQKLEIHRHLGVDLVFITQDPSLIDSHDRKLCELHFHVMRTFGMQRATIHEFRPVRENVLKSRKGSIEHKWTYPREAFTWYKSAEAHTHKARIPLRVWLFFALPLVVVALAWIAWRFYLDPHRARPGQPAPGSTSSPTAATPQRTVKTAEEYFAEQQPRVPGLAYTAPVYDQLTQPKQVPYPAACIQSATRCQCYTQQGTRLQMDSRLCADIATKGFFVAWQDPKNGAPTPAGPIRADTPQLTGATSIGHSSSAFRGEQIAPASVLTK